MGVALKGLGSYVGRGHRGCKHDLQQPQHCGEMGREVEELPQEKLNGVRGKETWGTLCWSYWGKRR